MTIIPSASVKEVGVIQTNTNLPKSTIVSVIQTNTNLPKSTIVSVIQTNTNLPKGTIVSVIQTNTNLPKGTTVSVIQTNTNLPKSTIVSYKQSSCEISLCIQVIWPVKKHCILQIVLEKSVCVYRLIRQYIYGNNCSLFTLHNNSG